MPVVIEMVSDLVCPWCWLGKRRIEAAMAMVPDVEVELLFRPYELDPSIPAGGVDYKEYMRKAFSSPEAKERSGAMRQALIDYGEAEDIPYRFDEITWRPNSLDAHRLVHWAQGQKKGAAAKEACSGPSSMMGATLATMAFWWISPARSTSTRPSWLTFCPPMQMLSPFAPKRNSSAKSASRVSRPTSPTGSSQHRALRRLKSSPASSATRQNTLRLKQHERPRPH
jgi:hypothetical protein